MTLNQMHRIRSDKRIDLDEIKGVIRAYVAIWGSTDERDSFDTWFDRSRPPEMDLDLLPIALRYEHGMDGVIKFERIGEITAIAFDDVGIFFDAQLDNSSPFFERVVEEIRHGTPDGALRTSSGTLGYLAEFFDDGAFKIWPVAEVSLTSLPSESRMPDVELLRSGRGEGHEEPVNNQTDAEQGENFESNESETNSTETRQMNVMDILQEAGLTSDSPLDDVIAALVAGGITLDDLQAAIDAMKPPEEGGEAPSEEEVEAASERSEVENILVAVQKAIDGKQTAEDLEEGRSIRAQRDQLRRENALLNARMAAPPSQSPPTGDTTQRSQITDMNDLRFGHLSAKEMVFGVELAKARKQTLSNDYYRHMHVKVSDLVTRGPTGFKDMRNFNSIRSAFPYRADEIMHTENTGAGLEWVPTAWSSMLWETAQVAPIFDALLSAGMMQVEITAGDSIYVPLEGADPTLYSAAENTSVGADGKPGVLVDPSVAGTSRVLVTPKKAMAVTYISTEQIEDSIIPMIPQVTAQTERAFVHGLEYLLLSGDQTTTVNTNINLIDGTPATGTGAPLYLVSDGALLYALVDGTSTSVSGGVLTSDDFLTIRGLLPDANAAMPNELIYVSDVSTMLKSLTLLDVKTQDVFKGATIENGVLTGVWGSPYLTSGQMGLANTSGMISATAGNNTKGRLLCIYAKYWAMVMKRAVRTSVTDDPLTDTTAIISSVRVEFKARGAGASTASYNLTV